MFALEKGHHSGGPSGCQEPGLYQTAPGLAVLFLEPSQSPQRLAAEACHPGCPVSFPPISRSRMRHSEDLRRAELLLPFTVQHQKHQGLNRNFTSLLERDNEHFLFEAVKL